MLLISAGLFAKSLLNLSRTMAPSATAARVRAMVLGDALRMFAVGAPLGLALAAALTRLLASQFYGLQSSDLAVYASATALLAGSSLLAAYFPAHGAGAVDPNLARRHE